jgi:hypothetical protein
MNYPAMRYVAEVCDVPGAGRALLWAISYRANPRSGVCSAGQRRLAREAGIARSTVQDWLPLLVALGELEEVFEGSGRHPACYRIVGCGRVPSGPTTGPQSISPDGLVDRQPAASGPIDQVLVDRSGPASGPVVGHKGSEVIDLKEEHEGSDESAPSERALSSGRADTRPTPPPPELAQELARVIGRRIPVGDSDRATVEANRARQLAELERRFPDEFSQEQGAAS